MNWIKKFAQRLLSEELAEERKHYQKINNDLRADKEAWALATEFIRAQNNILSEFRKGGLL